MRCPIIKEELQMAEELLAETEGALDALIEKFKWSRTDAKNPIVVLHTKIQLFQGRQELRRRDK